MDSAKTDENGWVLLRLGNQEDRDPTNHLIQIAIRLWVIMKRRRVASGGRFASKIHRQFNILSHSGQPSPEEHL